MFKTLFSRMLATYLSVTLGLLFLLGITVGSMFQQQYIGEKESELRREAEEDQPKPNPPAETQPSEPEASGLAGARFEIVSVGVNSVQVQVNVTGLTRVWCVAVKEFSALPVKDVEKEAGHEVRAEESVRVRRA